MGLGGDDRRLWFLSTSSSNAHLRFLPCPAVPKRYYSARNPAEKTWSLRRSLEIT